MSRKKDRSDLTHFIPFLLVHDFLFDDPTSLEYICKGFQVFFIYIRGKSYGPSIFKLNGRLFSKISKYGIAGNFGRCLIWAILAVGLIAIN